MRRHALKPWGYHLMINLYRVNRSKINQIQPVVKYINMIIPKIGMVAHGECHVERFGEGELEGISAMQFIETSSITVHCDEVDDRVFIDIFSCKEFNPKTATDFSYQYFNAQSVDVKFIER